MTTQTNSEENMNDKGLHADNLLVANLRRDIATAAEALQLADHLVLQGGFKSPKKVTAEIIAELERVVAELEEPDTRPRKIINDHITKLKAKETQL